MSVQILDGVVLYALVVGGHLIFVVHVCYVIPFVICLLCVDEPNSYTDRNSNGRGV